ncbi:hypothetical protein ACJVDH_17790 [Pedobacter sp. AW1-32]|uniref:hypothetical protein n=1 Tax=Pedobacter sp. AW1-32 TaxID=3383026 RepID=UPI003FEDCD1F
MKNYFLILLLVFAAQLGFAQSPSGKWSIKPAVGFQTTNFDWSIAGDANGGNPNVLSEVIWQNLKGMQYGLDIQYKLSDKFGIKAVAQYGNFGKGSATDTDYADDNRQRPFYEDQLNSNKGNIFSTGLQINYRLWQYKNFSLTPLLGISYLHQRYYLLASESNPNSAGLNSTYTISNRGWDFGTEIGFREKHFALSATVIGGFYTYAATASWNLIPTFAQPISFTQDANSFRFETKFNLSVPITSDLSAELDYRINKLNTKTGVDRTFYTDAPGDETQFNGGTLRNNSLQVGLNFRF